MFTKNIKLIGIVALIVVIVMVLSAVIAINNDKKVAEELGSAVENVNGSVNNTKEDYEKKIAELNAAIDALKATLADVEAGLADANDVIAAQGALIEALEKVNSDLSTELDKWGEATLALGEKMLEAEKIAYDFVTSFTNEETGVNFNDYFDYVTSWTFDEEGNLDEVVYCYEAFEELSAALEIALARAESVEEMDALLAQFKADIEAVPTRVEAIEAALAELEADAIVYGDYEAIMYANYLAYDANDAIFAPATEETEGEFAAFAARFDALTEAFGPVVLDHFVELAETLPEAYAVLYSHKETIETLMDDAQLIVNLLSDEELDVLYDDEEFVALVENYLACVDRLPAVVALYDAAVELNEFLVEDSEEKEIKANLETRAWLVTLYDAVTAWETTHGIVTDVEADDYVADLYNYVDRSIIAGYEATLLADGTALKAEADAFIAIVKGISKITPDSGDELDAAVLAYNAVSADPATIDTIFAIEEDGVVAAWNKVVELQASYNTLFETIKAFNDTIDAVIIKCTCPDDSEEECECKVGEIDETLAATVDCAVVDGYIFTVLETYELDVTVFKAELLEAYKVIRLYDDLAAIYAILDDVYAASANENKDVVYANLEKFIALDAATAYTFELEVVCDCVEECEYECECEGECDHFYNVIAENAA